MPTPLSKRPRHATAFASLVLSLSALLTGCTLGSIQLSGPASDALTARTAFQGTVHGGQQPVIGSTIQIYLAGVPTTPSSSTGFGKGATALIVPGSMTLNSTNNFFPGGASGCKYVTGNTNNCTALPTTDANGNWSITGDYTYTCASAKQPVYVVATGGSSDGTATDTNPYIALMASLGQCANIGSLSSINLNEVTTVGAVWALQQFMAPPSGAAAGTYTSQGGSTAGVAVNIGAPAGQASGYNGVYTYVTGLINASAMVDNLVDYNLGAAQPRPLNTWATPYTALINTLADIIASCVNTVPSTSNTTCASMMSQAATTTATSASGTAYTPADTLQLAWQMAQNPTNNVVNLTANVVAGAPFMPTVASPLNFSVSVGLAPTYSSGTLGAVSSAIGGAVDQYGHVWVLNSNNAGNGTGGLTSPFVTEIDANGNYLAGPFYTYSATGGFGGGTDPCGSSYVHTLNYSGTYNGPRSIVIDQNNTVWVGNAEESVTTGTGNCNTTSDRSLMKITGSSATGTGAAIATGTYFYGNPYSLVVDGSNNVWGAGAGAVSATSFGYVQTYTGTNNATYASSSTIVSGTGGSAAKGEVGETSAAATADMAGNVWFVSEKGCASTVSILYQIPVADSTNPQTPQGYYSSGASTCGLPGAATATTTAFASYILGIAADANNGLWAASDTGTSATSTVTYYAPASTAWAKTGNIGSAGALTSTAGVGGIDSPYGVAVDGSNHAWFANYVSGGVSELSATVTSSGVTAITSPQQSVTSSISGSSVVYTGFAFPSTNSPFPYNPKGISIDPSGNVWVFSNHSSSSNYVTVMVGAATPVMTPLTNQVKYSLVGSAPAQ